MSVLGTELGVQAASACTHCIVLSVYHLVMAPLSCHNWVNSHPSLRLDIKLIKARLLVQLVPYHWLLSLNSSSATPRPSIPKASAPIWILIHFCWSMIRSNWFSASILGLLHLSPPKEGDSFLVFSHSKHMSRMKAPSFLPFLSLGLEPEHHKHNSFGWWHPPTNRLNLNTWGP